MANTKLYRCAVRAKYCCINKPWRLHDHLVVHGPRPSYRCAVCDKRYASRDSLRRHLFRHTDGRPFRQGQRFCEVMAKGRLYQCAVCAKYCLAPSMLRNHLIVHGPRSSYRCAVCGKHFANRKNHLKRHLFLHTSGRPFRRGQRFCETIANRKLYQCAVCAKYCCIKPWSLRNHLIVHGPRSPYRCAVCGKHSADRGRLKQHLFRHTDARPFGCPDCPKHFKTKNELRRHTKGRRVDRHRRCYCSRCTASFANRRGLAVHLVKHGEFACPYPTHTSSYTKRSCLGNRTRSCHASIGPKMPPGRRRNDIEHQQPLGYVICAVCGTSLSSKTSLASHITNLHQQQRRFLCERCPAMYANASSLMAHVRRHTGERPFSCARCAARFPTKYRLAEHLRSYKHSRPRRMQHGYRIFPDTTTEAGRYGCATCLRRFPVKAALRRHLL